MKTVEELYQQMCEIFARETGMRLHDGSEMAVRFYTMATQLHGLYVQNEWTLTQCFPQTAKGIHLDYHATLRGLKRNAATRAQGKLRFSVAEVQTVALRIPAGTVCMTAGLVRFATQKEASLPAGEAYVDVEAEAVDAGSAGNVPAGSVRVMSVAPVSIAACTNPTAFLGGAAAEEDENLRRRVLETYKRMPNGANSAYYEREALSFEEVAAVNVIPRSRGRGTVDVVLSGVSGDPGEAVRTAVFTHLQEQREIAVDVRVLPPTEALIDVSVTLKVSEGVQFGPVKEAVQEALVSYFDGRQLGKAILRAKLGQLIYALDGVENYQITLPAQDLAATPGKLWKLRNLTVTEETV